MSIWEAIRVNPRIVKINTSMTDEEINAALEQGRRAGQELALTNLAFDSLKRDCFNTLVELPAAEAQGPEGVRLITMVQIIEGVRNVLKNLVEKGEAADELKKLLNPN